VCFNIDFKDDYEFKVFFESILNKMRKNIFGFRIVFFLDKNISLEIGYVLSNLYAHTFKATIIENQVVVSQVFNLRDLFNRLSQLNLLDVFYNEVMLWHLCGGYNE
jgi:hypothetical protein